MNKLRLQQLAVAGLLLLFMGAWFYTRKGAHPAVRPPQPSQQLPKPSSASSAAGAPEQQPAPTPESAAKRDPFQLPPLLREAFQKKAQAQAQERERLARSARAAGAAPTQVEPQLPSLTLQGILWGVEKPQAIINRRIVSVGDAIEQAQVQAVTPQGVRLLFNGRELLLELPGKEGAQAQQQR